MKALIVYNKGLGKDYVLYKVVENLIQEGKSLGVDLIPRSNEDLFVYQDGLGQKVLGLDFDPAFVLFYDKDLTLARALEKKGYPVFNSPRSIALCDNKLKTYQALEGLPLPKTILGPKRFQPGSNEDFIKKVLTHLGQDLVVKEAIGSFGQQVHLVHGDAGLKQAMETLSSKDYLIQEYIKETRGKDLRVVLVGDQVLGGMERSNNKDFRANIYLGAKATQVDLNPEETQLAKACHQRLGLSFSGVDLLYSSKGPLVCEVNSNLSYLGFAKATGLNVGRRILEYSLSCL